LISMIRMLGPYPSTTSSNFFSKKLESKKGNLKRGFLFLLPGFYFCHFTALDLREIGNGET
ncbi:hypothetical protein, partial [Dialister hominis]|uniref:hypothetical protein n=1 Tax=Dialister hominis TaxID=2582419 RepID=UPI00307A79DC